MEQSAVARANHTLVKGILNLSTLHQAIKNLKSGGGVGPRGRVKEGEAFLKAPL